MCSTMTINLCYSIKVLFIYLYSSGSKCVGKIYVCVLEVFITLTAGRCRATSNFLNCKLSASFQVSGMNY